MVKKEEKRKKTSQRPFITRNKTTEDFKKISRSPILCDVMHDSSIECQPIPRCYISKNAEILHSRTSSQNYPFARNGIKKLEMQLSACQKHTERK